MEMGLPLWKYCFICSSDVVSRKVRKTASRTVKGVGFELKTGSILLLEYLLKGKTAKCNPVLDNPLRELRGGDDGGDDELLCRDAQIIRKRLKFCRSCEQLSGDVANLHVQLEVIQMKLIEKIKMAKHKVIANSRLYGSHPEILEKYEQLEKCFDEKEGMGSDCSFGRKFLDLLHQFQTAVFENDVDKTNIPLVYLQEYNEDDVRIHTAHGESNPSLWGTSDKKPMEIKSETQTKGKESSVKSARIKSRVRKRKVAEPKRIRIRIRANNIGLKHSHRSKEHTTQQPLKRPLTEAQYLARDLAMKVSVEKASQMKIKQRRSLTCEHCTYQTIKGIRMETHLRSHETAEKSHECPDCKQKFTTKQYFEFHVTRVCGGSSHTKCDVCAKYIPKANIKEHLETLHKSLYKCDFCDNIFGAFESLLNHSSMHSGVKWSCPKCPEGNNEEYSRRTSLIRHLYKVHGHIELMLPCDEPNCSRKFFDRNALSSHKNIHMRRFVCEICDRACMSRVALDIHRRTQHLNDKPVECELCSERFTYKTHLEKHQILEHNFPKFVCDVCPGKEYFDSGCLSTHKRTRHTTAERPSFACEVCQKEFQTKANLNKHALIHGDNNFTCEICGFATRTKSLVKTHMLKHDGTKKFACTHCPKMFTQKKYLRDHLRIHTQEKPFQCDLCGSSFNQKGSLNLHKKKHTGSLAFPSDGPSFTAKNE